MLRGAPSARVGRLNVILFDKRRREQQLCRIPGICAYKRSSYVPMYVRTCTHLIPVWMTYSVICFWYEI